MTRVLVVAALFTALASSPATAQPPSTEALAPTDENEDEGELVSYWTTTLAIDSAAGALILGGAALALSDTCDSNGNRDDESSWCTLAPISAVAGFATWLIGPTIAHASLGTRRSAIASMALRVTLPAAGFLIGEALGDGDAFDYTGPMLAIGGIGGAMLIDWFVLSKAARRPSSPLRPGARRFPAPIMPSVAPTPDGLRLGLGGTF